MEYCSQARPEKGLSLTGLATPGAPRRKWREGAAGLGVSGDVGRQPRLAGGQERVCLTPGKKLCPQIREHFRLHMSFLHQAQMGECKPTKENSVMVKTQRARGALLHLLPPCLWPPFAMSSDQGILCLTRN
ncbi:Hypothetical predicted protein [Marmota monax]|uniref:Uncharacterized protein n=1 Tax=Marmota monax TaxID=9995 RepID=A0A5E4A6G9_MARMO|nr:hypothetical protein GHT09_012940 [Marmota monax]VTJ52800.1 Hypothetical predicted protein [Marmota monax]